MSDIPSLLGRKKIVFGSYLIFRVEPGALNIKNGKKSLKKSKLQKISRLELKLYQINHPKIKLCQINQHIYDEMELLVQI